MLVTTCDKGSMGARVGDLLSVKLGRGRFGVVQVAWTKPEWGHVSLVALDGFFDRPPTLAEVKKLGVMELRHPFYDGPFWVRILRGNKLPPFLSLIGRAPLRPAAARFPLGDRWEDPDELRRSTMWKALPATLHREDRYRNDPRYAKEVLGWARPGDVFAFPDERGFAVCRIFRVAGRIEDDRYAFRRYVDRARTAARGAPTLEAAMRALAGSTESAFTTCEPPPEGALLVGHAPQTKKEKTRRCNVLTSWPAVKREAARKTARSKAPSREGVTLETITPRSLYPSWKNTMPAEELALTRRIVAKLVTALRRAKATGERAQAEGAIDQAVLALNDADVSIETTEREDLCALLGALGRSAGLPGRAVDARVERTRTW